MADLRSLWGAYKQALIRNSDVRKLNDGYRQILAGPRRSARTRARIT